MTTIDEQDDLALATNPRFVNAMVRLVEALDKTEIPWDKIRRVPWPMPSKNAQRQAAYRERKP